MSEIKVGDKVRVTRLMVFDKPNGIVKDGTYEVVELDSDGDGVFVNTTTRKNVGLIYEQIEKVEEEEQVSEFKVGDKVRVKWVDEQDKCRYISKGDCFTVLRVDRDGDIRVDLPNGELGCLFKHQVELVEDEGKVELVENEEQVSEFKVGDKVKVISLQSWKDQQHLQVGKTYTVDRVDNDGWPLIITDGVLHNMMPSQVEKVEDKTEFTFPQMAQKLIDGEFEEGTELVTNEGSTYFVDRAGYKQTYGLKSSKNGGLVVSEIGASDFNATWKVKEQSIKEMSIEDIQKELGYKIKVTE